MATMVVEEGRAGTTPTVDIENFIGPFVIVRNNHVNRTFWVGHSAAISPDAASFPVLPGQTVAIPIGDLQQVWAVADVNWVTFRVMGLK